jgi:hypothetical protein
MSLWRTAASVPSRSAAFYALAMLRFSERLRTRPFALTVCVQVEESYIPYAQFHYCTMRSVPGLSILMLIFM